MKKLVTLIASTLCIIGYSDAVQYRIPRDTVDVRTVEVDGHKYIVASCLGSGNSWVPSVSLSHFAGCKCKENKKDNVKSDQGPRLFSKEMRLRKYEEQNGICIHCTNRFEFAGRETT